MTDRSFSENTSADRPSPLLDSEDAAKYLQLSSTTLRKMRCRGGGPDYYKVGGRVFYTYRTLDNWLQERRFKSTSVRVATE